MPSKRPSEDQGTLFMSSDKDLLQAETIDGSVAKTSNISMISYISQSPFSGINRSQGNRFRNYELLDIQTVWNLAMMNAKLQTSNSNLLKSAIAVLFKHHMP